MRYVVTDYPKHERWFEVCWVTVLPGGRWMQSCSPAGSNC